jgi:hypothetical protein
MKPYRWTLPILLFAFAQFAHADTFDITQITFTVGPFNATLPGIVSFSLTGPGTNITGVGNFVCQSAWCSFPASSVPPGSLLTNIGQIGLDEAFQSTVGGTTLIANQWTVIDLALNVLGSINLPANPSSSVFSACVPATVPINFGEGQIPDKTVINFNLNPPHGGAGTFCTTWNFSNGQYTFVQGTFTASTVPEPGTLGLVGSGLVALFAAALRRRTAVGTKC